MLSDVAYLDALAPVIRDGDLDTIATRTDWLGVNYFAPTRIAPLPDPRAVGDRPLPGLRGVDILPPRGRLTSSGAEQDPGSLLDLLRWLHRYAGGIPLIVIGNGAAFADTVDNDGRVRDPNRTRYFAEHLRAVHAAIEHGADVRGYFAWSVMDGFVWERGFSERWGLVHVDFQTQRRTIKDSARFFAEVVESNAVPPAGPPR